MGGVGKTTLAIHAAHRITEEFPDLFTDGHLFLDLRGFTPGKPALTAHKALRSLLRGLGVPNELIPANPQMRETVYRTMLADRKTLLILDNARNAAQVRPLLPGAGGCMVIVTSRESLLSLDGAAVLPLFPPPEEEAIRLFRTVAGPDRVRADDPALKAIIKLCGSLPLAIQIKAARMSRRDSLQLSDIRRELREAHGLLAHLKDKERNVTAVFETSLRHADPAERRLFGQLGLIPGDDFDVYAAASLSGDSFDATRDRLESLLDQHLLVQLTPGRYQFHDLVRVYARSLSVPGRDRAVENLLNFYLYTAQSADRAFERGLPRADRPAGGAVRPAAMPRLSGSDEAQAWFGAELSNLTAAAACARDNGHARVTIGLSSALSDYLRSHGPWQAGISLHRVAHEAAAAARDPRGQAAALRNIGGLQMRIGDIATSIETLSDASRAYDRCGDIRGKARALIELGMAQRAGGDIDECLATLTTARDICRRQLGDRQGEAAALTELGSVLWIIGPLPEAERLLSEAMTIYQDLRNRQGTAAALLYLGTVQLDLGELEAAAATLRDARVTSERLGLPLFVANSLLYLSDVQCVAGQTADAEQSAGHALTLYRQLNHRQGIAYALRCLGRTLVASRRYDEAEARLTEALGIFGELNDKGGKAEVLNARATLVTARRALAGGEGGSQDTARGYREKAFEFATEAFSLGEQAAALTGLAALDEEDARADAARAHYAEALARYERLQSPAGIARVKEHLRRLDP
jgi:tetratricopeptide (TPR) repeat protein